MGKKCWDWVRRGAAPTWSRGFVAVPSQLGAVVTTLWLIPLQRRAEPRRSPTLPMGTANGRAFVFKPDGPHFHLPLSRPLPISRPFFAKTATAGARRVRGLFFPTGIGDCDAVANTRHRRCLPRICAPVSPQRPSSPRLRVSASPACPPACVAGIRYGTTIAAAAVVGTQHGKNTAWSGPHKRLHRAVSQSFHSRRFRDLLTETGLPFLARQTSADGRTN